MGDSIITFVVPDPGYPSKYATMKIERDGADMAMVLTANEEQRIDTLIADILKARRVDSSTH